MAAKRQWDNIFKMLRENVNIKLCSHSLQFFEISSKNMGKQGHFQVNQPRK